MNGKKQIVINGRVLIHERAKVAITSQGEAMRYIIPDDYINATRMLF